MDKAIGTRGDHPEVRRSTRNGILACTVAVLSFLALLLFSPTAHADVGSVDQCQRSPEHGCVEVNIFGAGRERVAGIRVTLAGPEGAKAEGESTADGPVVFQATVAETYSVSIDQSSLPQEYAGADTQPRDLTVQFGSTARGTFDLTQASATASASAAPSPQAKDTPGQESTPSPSSGAWFDRMWQQLASGVRFGLLLALASIGANLIYGTTRVSNFAHGEQVTLGAVLSYLLVQSGLPLLAAALVAVGACAASGWLQDAAVWKPLRNRGTPVTQVMIVTIGLSIALQFLIQFLVGTGTFQVVTGNPTTFTFGPVTMTRISLLAMGISVVVLAAVAWFLTRTRLGRATRAVSDNPALAAATGINTNAVVRLVWTLAAGLAGLAGLLLALTFGASNWNMGLQMLLLMFAAITLGGLGTANGALVGSLIIGLSVELSSLVIPTDLRYVTALFILIVVLLLRPQGILGLRERIS